MQVDGTKHIVLYVPSFFVYTRSILLSYDFFTSWQRWPPWTIWTSLFEASNNCDVTQKKTTATFQHHSQHEQNSWKLGSIQLGWILFILLITLNKTTDLSSILLVIFIETENVTKSPMSHAWTSVHKNVFVWKWVQNTAGLNVRCGLIVKQCNVLNAIHSQAKCDILIN